MSNFKQTVALQNVKCFAYHGFYAEEQIIGNHFIVDIETVFTPGDINDDLQKTINYEELNAIILSEMKNTQKLLETVVKNILERSIKLYPFIEEGFVSIRKLNPAMLGAVGQSFVKLNYQA